MLRKLMLMTALFAGTTQAKAEPVERFTCVPGTGEASLRLEGTFELDARVRGRGTLAFCREGFCHPVTGVPFQRGMWTLDRMNAYVRDEHGSVVAGLIVEDYFAAPQGAELTGHLYGIAGNTTLTCVRGGWS